MSVPRRVAGLLDLAESDVEATDLARDLAVLRPLLEDLRRALAQT